MNQHQAASSLDETLVVAAGPSQPKKKRRAVALVEGSSPKLSAETYDLLRQRMRSASLLLFAGYLIFFVRRLLFPAELQTTLDWALLAMHALMTLVCGLVGLRLCTNCPHMLRHLRKAELSVFGGSALFFIVLSYSALDRYAAKGYVMPIAHIWLLLIFTYALFIPNSLRRGGVVIGSMAVAPVVVMFVAWATSSEFAQLARTNTDFPVRLTENALLMALAAATAVWGSHTMGSLRAEAFEARQLGQYRLKRPLGRGGMGEVYLAEHLLLKRPSAVKLIRPDKAGDSQALARFEREVKATAKLTHWNTVEIYDYGRADDGTFYYVMEYLPGMNLGQLVEMCGPLPPGRVIYLLAQTCDALAEAHDNELIHRDIKPANIFAANRGGVFDVVKLLDFGLAKPLTNVTGTQITLEGTFTGSPLYMSPEQATGDGQVDARSDIYSLGLVAYYLLAGKPPFDFNTPLKIIMAHARDEPPPPSRHNPDVPGDLEQVVMRCLEKDPDHRFQDVESLRQALLACSDAGSWNRQLAAAWWHNNGCPKKKALDVEVLAGSTA